MNLSAHSSSPAAQVSSSFLSTVCPSCFIDMLLSLPCPSPTVFPQVSFRYHCQLYSEWRRTNQKVRLLMPDMKGAHTTQRSVPTKLTKKMTDETIV